MTRPHDRGEKYVGPQILPGETSDFATPGWPISRVIRQRRLARTEAAHELIRKLDAAILKELAKPRP